MDMLYRFKNNCIVTGILTLILIFFVLVSNTHAEQLMQPPQTATKTLCPDLIVESISAQTCTHCSCQCAGKTYSISSQVFEGAVVIVKNIGNARSGVTRLEISAEKGFFSSGPNAYVDIPPIDPGKRYIVRVPGFHVFYDPHATGLRIHATVDYQNMVSECNESNNMTVVTSCNEYREAPI
jgi:hypothetical protein